MHSSNHALRLSRRKLLVLLGGSAAGASLLAASGTAFAETEARDRDTVLHAAVAAVLGQSGLAAAQASDQLAGYRQATQTGFSPVNSTLTFGSPTDVAAGWDGTSWAIDEQGAPHVYDPLSDTWQLHGTGLDAAVTSFPWLYPSVYFKGSEVLIADGQHAVQSIATAWPQMPKSYQQGVMGAIAVEGHLDFKFMLFRSGTYLTVPAPPPAQGVAAPPNAPLAPFAVPTSTTPTPVAAGTPHAGTPVVSPTSDAGTAVATPTPRPVAEVYHAAFLAAETTTPSAVPTSRDTPSATVRPSDTPTNAPSPSPTPAAATATASTATTQTPTPASAASQTATPATPTPSTATPTPSTATPTSAASPVPTPSPTPPTDYVARPLNVITGWPQTASWQDGIIDGVYGGTYGAYLIRGGEYVQLGFSRDGDSINIAVSNGPSPVGNLGSFLPNLPAAWQSSGFDTGFDVIGADGRVDHTVITSGAQALVIDRTGSVASPSEMATPKPSSANTTVYHAALIAATTPTPGAAAASATPATTPTRGTTPTATSTATPRPSASPTDAPSLSPTATATPAASETATPAATPTMGDTATPTATPVASETVTPTPTPAASETATPVATETATPTPSASGGQPATIAVAAGLSYIPRALSGWPASWHPQLQHAPNGRSSGLWAATVEGSVVSFDGTAWTQQSGDALSVGVGKDGTVFAVGKNNPKQLSQWDGSAFAPVATHSADLTQVSVGTKAQVWTRDSTNAVHQLNQGQLQPVPLAGSAADIAANHDGTLWSCTGSDPQVQRLASDLNQTPASVAVAGTVQKVASTGFGVAHCLVAQNDTTQLYRYDSPYVFRTPGDYVFPKVAPIEEGLGSLFFVTQSSTYATGAPEPKYQVVALDAQTGQELSRSAIAPPGLLYTPPAFDPVHNVLIVGLTVDTFVQSSVPTGQLLGLDARDLTNVRWSITLPNDTGGDNQPVPVGPGRPTLQGTQLCVSDGTQSLVMYDTGGPDATTPTWRWTQTDLPSGSAKLTPPVISKGSVYAAWWRQPAAGQPDAGNVELWLWKLSADDSSGGFPMLASFPPDAALDLYWDVLADQPPVLATVSGPQAGQSRQVLFVSGGTTVWGIDVDAATAQSYHLPGSGSGAPYVISGFGYADGVLWFGDTDATLYGLDAQTLQPVPNTPATFGPGTIATTPLLYTDAKAEAAVLFSIVNGTEPPGLIVFDPTSGNTISIPTQGTQLVGLGATATNGVVYAGGGTFSDTPDPNNAKQLTAQVFAIRVDQAVQQLRDFVVDSQLMQDFDDPSQPTHDPSGVARYQTQLTLVDSTRAPLANTTVKLWADQPNTTVLVNGQSLTLGPDDDDYAVVATGNDGALVITSGSTQRDSKGAFADGADMTAVPLRAWAHFMDPYERMVIYRDREFHNRVSTAHATDPNQAGADDPTRANIQTAQAYGAVQQGGGNTGTSLFTDQQKQQGQPQNVTNAIQKMTGAVGTAPPKSSKNLKASWSLQSVDTPGKYVVYPDTPGAQYSPVNVAANRPAIVLQTTGLSYTSSNDGAAPLAYNPLSPAEATMAIDALEGQDWLTSVHATPRVKAAAESGTLHLGSWWDDFWNWLKGAAATVTHVIVSVGEEIYLGIRAVVGEIESVFRTIIADIAEVANAIGSFFMQLGRLIEEIIEALSVLFQFGHIIDTHNRLKKELLKRINGDGSAAYPGLTALVLGDKTKNISGAVDHVDNFFNQGEQAISDAINKLADALAGSSVTDLQGGGATAHSTLSATPKSGGASASTATQGTWALNKFNGGIGSSTVTATASRHLLAADDPISAFFNTFAASLSGDGNLTSQWAKVQSGAQGLSNATSPADFIKQGLAELLRVLALLLDGALAVSNAFVDGLLATIASLIQTMFAPDADGNPTSGGILSEPLDFPVLSWLYQLLFGEPLTILNALMLVIAIPVTILWRIVEGQWPSDSLSVGDARRQGEVGDAPALLQRLMSYASAISTACLGFVYAAGDALGESGGPALLGRAALGGSLLVSICSIPTFSSDSPSTYVWASWGLGLGSALLNILSSINFSGEGGTISTIIGSFVLTALSLALTGVMGVQFGEDPPPDLIGKAVLGIDIATQLPGVINTWKLTGEILAVVVAIADVVMGFAGAVATLISALA